MASVSFARIGLAASVAGLTVFSVQAASAAGPASACPGQASVGPSAATVPAPGGMPANCTVAFSDGTVNYAGGVTGYAADGFTGVTTIYDQEGQIVGVTNSLGETTYLTPAPTAAPVATLTDSLGHVTRFSYDCDGIGRAGRRSDGRDDALSIRLVESGRHGDGSARPRDDL